MADNIPITPGSGKLVATDDVGGVQFQRNKLDMGGDGISIPVVGDAAYGIPVDVKRVAGTVSVTAATPLPVDASGAVVPISASAAIPVSAPTVAPVAVRLSNGAINIDTVPVSGSVTAAQGPANTTANAWPIKVTDGTTVVGVTGGALNVNVAGGGGGGTDQPDSSTFTIGSSDLTPVGGLYNDSAGDPASGQVAVGRITQKRAQHVNLRDNAGVELGSSGNPMRTDPTGGTSQPVSGTVQGDITKVNGTTIGTLNPLPVTGPVQADIIKVNGTTIGPANPLPVTMSGQAQTRVTKSVAMTASQTASALWTPAGGKKFVVRSLILTITGTGALAIFDGSNAGGNMVYQGTPPVGATIELQFGGEPWLSSTADNVLRYTSGSGLTGDVVTNGFEA